MKNKVLHHVLALSFVFASSVGLTQTVEYQIRRGDTLSEIALEYLYMSDTGILYGTQRRPGFIEIIADYNHIANPDLIYMDDTLLIPDMRPPEMVVADPLLPPVEPYVEDFDDDVVREPLSPLLFPSFYATFMWGYAYTRLYENIFNVATISATGNSFAHFGLLAGAWMTRHWGVEIGARYIPTRFPDPTNNILDKRTHNGLQLFGDFKYALHLSGGFALVPRVGLGYVKDPYVFYILPTRLIMTSQSSMDIRAGFDVLAELFGNFWLSFGLTASLPLFKAARLNEAVDQYSWGLFADADLKLGYRLFPCLDVGVFSSLIYRKARFTHRLESAGLGFFNEGHREIMRVNAGIFARVVF